MFINVYAHFFHQKHIQFKYVFTIFACAHQKKLQNVHSNYTKTVAYFTYFKQHNPTVQYMATAIC